MIDQTWVSKLYSRSLDLNAEQQNVDAVSKWWNSLSIVQKLIMYYLGAGVDMCTEGNIVISENLSEKLSLYISLESVLDKH